MDIRPLHQGISVPDMDSSISWYSDVLGFEKHSDEFIEMLNARVVFMRLGDFELELFEYRGDDKKPLPPERREPNEDLKTCGTKHVAWATDDFHGLTGRFREKGVDFAIPEIRMGDDLVCFVRDNSGILIEFIQKNV